MKNDIELLAAFLQIRGLFDSNKDEKISKEELTADPRRVRAAGLGGVTFEQLDAETT
jgi:hypothetical protein